MIRDSYVMVAKVNDQVEGHPLLNFGTMDDEFSRCKCLQELRFAYANLRISLFHRLHEGLAAGPRVMVVELSR